MKRVLAQNVSEFNTYESFTYIYQTNHTLTWFKRCPSSDNEIVLRPSLKSLSECTRHQDTLPGSRPRVICKLHMTGCVIMITCNFSNATQITVWKVRNTYTFLKWPTFVNKSQGQAGEEFVILITCLLLHLT